MSLQNHVPRPLQMLDHPLGCDMRDQLSRTMMSAAAPVKPEGVGQGLHQFVVRGGG